ncbi:hypothetical protein ABPG74_006001 [Tetrahymena malaccensis]
MSQESKYKVVFVRHGQSEWNLKNIFTGWHDIPLSEQGHQEATLAGQILKQKGYSFDLAITSVLQRSIQTFNHIAEELQIHHIPIIKSWRLNERHYGSLQGLNKSETAALHGEAQVKIWRRSYDVRPPEMSIDHPDYPGKDQRYKHIPPSSLPKGECLKDTVERVLPFWTDTICKAIIEGQKVIVSAHGNSLRAIVKYLDKMTDEQIMELDIPTGVPLVYELDENLLPVKHYYLISQEELEKKMQEVKNQGKAQQN